MRWRFAPVKGCSPPATASERDRLRCLVAMSRQPTYHAITAAGKVSDMGRNTICKPIPVHGMGLPPHRMKLDEAARRRKHG